MLNTLFQQSLNLFFLVGFVLVTTGLGMLVLKKIKIPLADWGGVLFFSIGIGFGIFSYSIFILGIFQLLQPAALSILLSFFTILSIFGWFNSLSFPGRPVVFRKPNSRIEQFAVLFLLLVLLGSFILSLTPDPGKDALIYHLAVPKLFLKHRGFYFISGNIFSNYPLLNEMLFLVGLFLRGEVLAKGMHFMALLGILLGIWEFSKLKIIPNYFPFLSMLIFLSIPSVFIVSHMAYVDLFITYYSLAAALAFICWLEGRSSGRLTLCGIFSGLAVSSKYTALLLPLLGCLGILWSFSRDRVSWRPVIRSLFLYTAVTVLLGAPFYIKNWIMAGNPFYPFFYEIFGGRGWDPNQARLYDYFVSNLGMGRNVLDFLLLPWNLSMRAKIGSSEFDGLLGPVFLLTLPFLIGIRAMRISVKIVLIYCALTFLFWASSAQQIRYLIPIFPFLAVLSGFILTQYQPKKFFWPVLFCLVLGSITFNGFYVIRDFLGIKPVGVVMGTEDRDSFLRRRLPSYDILDYCNTNLPDHSKLFLIYMKNWGFLLDRDYYSDSMFESYTIQKILTGSRTTEDVYEVLKAKGFTHMLFDLNYISGNLSTFSLEEKERFFDYQKNYLTLQKNEGPYYLFRIK